MENLCDMDLRYIDMKLGNIKIDSEELKMLFECLGVYHEILCNSLETLSDDEKRYLEKGIAVTEYMQNKYLLLGQHRLKQRQMYDFLKKFDNPEFTKNASPQEVEKNRRTVLEWYLEEKSAREKLQREVDKKQPEIFGLFENGW